MTTTELIHHPFLLFALIRGANSVWFNIGKSFSSVAYSISNIKTNIVY